ncbi:FHA domain-containing protein [Micromonospora sp. CPCC 205371]|nr:FHA domain-containing protein [Micromonospora sp. CPCC 205371]
MDLVVLGPPRLRGHGFQVTAQRAVIGRDEHATLTLADERVSRRHAAVWAANGATWIVDLGSRNGTLVNGAPVRDTPRQLADGDHIGIGDVTLVFQAGQGSVQYNFAGGQSAGQINNIGRDYNQSTHNRYDVDINPLPRSRTGRTLIILGVTLKLIGIIPFGYWVLAFMAEVFDALDSPAGTQPPEPDLPPFLPWVPIGLVLTMIGTALWIYGAIIAFSTRRRHQ